MTDKRNIVHFPNADTLEEEAAAWIVRLDGENATADDHAAFEAWCAQGPQYAEAARKAAVAWESLDALSRFKDRKESPLARPTLMERMGFEVRHRVAGLGGLAAAAAILIGLFIAAPFAPPDNPSTFVHRTVIGDQKTVALPDGSELLLNTDSEVEVALTDNGRDIKLHRGEVHFTVAPDKARPFSVYVDNRVITALGTAFAVHRRESDFEITVTEGDVRVFALPTIEGPQTLAAAATQTDPLADLTAGENAVVSDTVERVEVIPPPEMNRKLAWRQGLLAFAGEPLSDVVAEVSRYTDLEIIIRDPELKELRFGGFLKVGNVDTLFNALEQSFDVKVEREGTAKAYLSLTSL